MVTLDLYFYTDANLGTEGTTWFGIPSDQVRRAASYGETAMTRIRTVDALDGTYQPTGVLVELAKQSDLAGIPEMTDAGQVTGAVMSTLIHEARLISYFSHGFGSQGTADALYPADFPGTFGDAMRAAVSALHTQVQSLAPVLNTQSYVWSFNAGIRSMLKAKGAYAYIFAMQKRASATSGTFTFTVPTGIVQSGTVDVIGEGRTLTLTGGQFTDSFAAEYTYHIYKIPLGT